jgi:hypothetical protein
MMWGFGWCLPPIEQIEQPHRLACSAHCVRQCMQQVLCGHRFE